MHMPHGDVLVLLSSLLSISALLSAVSGIFKHLQQVQFIVLAILPEHSSSPGSKTVLCSFGQYSGPVSITSTFERSDFDSLSEAHLYTYKVWLVI